MVSLTRRDMSWLLDYGCSLGADFAEVFCQRQSEVCLSYESSTVDRLWAGVESGVSIRLVRAGNAVLATTNSLDRDVLPGLVRQAATVMRSSPGNGYARLSSSPLHTEPKTVPMPVVDARMIAAAAAIDAAARSYSPAVHQVRIVAAVTTRNIVVANSEGVFASDDRYMTTLSTSVVSVRGRQRELGVYSPGRASPLDRFLACYPPSQIGCSAAHLSVVQLDAVPAPVGAMPVVVGNGKGGALIHEACVHPLEGDFVSRDNSVYRGRLGEMIAAPGVTVIDDSIGTSDCPGAYAFDDEGSPGQATVLVERGRLCSYVTDRVAAARLRHPLTGNARRQSAEYLPLPRMSNTFIAPGELDPNEIIAVTKSGVYAKQVSGGEVNQITGEFVFSISEGYLIEGGKLGAPIRPTTLVGRGPDVLRDIDLIGSDLELAAAQCGKGNQLVMVGVGQPTIRIREMVVGGTRT